LPTPGAYIRVIGARQVEAKLLAATPRILAHNRMMVTSMLEFIKPEVEAATPIGPGHFGYHLKNSYKTDVASKGVKTIGVLKAPPQGYWLEFGTLGSFRKSGNPAGASMARAAFAGVTGRSYSGLATGIGERPRMLAHHALMGIKKFIKFYYGGLAEWYRL
jgi:hypothetical protein